MNRTLLPVALAICSLVLCGQQICGEEPELVPFPRVAGEAPPRPEPWEAPLNDAKGKLAEDVKDAKGRGDTAWMLASSALVLLMVPGLALFYGGMVRKKNVLATMMQSYAALAVVGLYWVAVGYSLAFGPSLLKVNFLGAKEGGLIGWSWDLFFLKGIASPDRLLPGLNISILTHVMFQGMFAIITPALISGALAERIRFWPFCIFMLLWVTFVYCPLAHMVWAYDWFYAVPDDPMKELGASTVGLLGKMGALDFAGGTVVHIAAGTAGLAAALVLRRRLGYPEHTIQPNSMVLTLIGAGLLWFGWFGFNGGSATSSGPLAASAFAATQAAAAAAGLSWMLVEWLCKGKPTALGLASGIVAGLVAVTPASGFVYIWGGVAIGLLAGIVCYFTVAMKSLFKYDDSLDAFGVHAVGGFLGAILTGLFCYAAVNGAGADGYFAVSGQKTHLQALRAKYSDAAALVEKAEELENRKKGQEKLAAAAKSEWEDVVKAAAAAQEAGFKADGKTNQGTAKKDFDKAKDERDKREEAYKKAAAELNLASADLKQMQDERAELTRLEVAAAARWAGDKGSLSQFFIQVKASLFALVFAFMLSMLLALLTQAITFGNFTTTKEKENEGLDLTEHGEIGFDLSVGYDSISIHGAKEPKAAKVPPGQKRFDVVVEGADNGALIKAWSDLCMPSEEPIDADFKAIYPYVTTIQGNRFRLRGGDPAALSGHVQKLFSKKLGKQLKVRVEE